MVSRESGEDQQKFRGFSENCFSYLDAPVIRCASLDTPVPFSSQLEKDFLAKSRFRKKLIELESY